ncbi:MAG: 2-hydroxyacyl-CoA dehydratase family protein [Dehalococcoidia bacterium]|nr:2-hydroxyacyl-CoA dehydratase family protein [Dehalococcoidia bacterium]
MADVVKEVGMMFSGMAKMPALSPEKAQGLGLVGKVYLKAAAAHEKGEPVAWISFSIPPEIFWAMDVVPVVDLNLATLTLIPGKAEKYIDLATEVVPDYICSTNRLPMGLALSGDTPLPTIWVVQNAPCDSIPGIDSSMAKYFGIPYYSVHVPYINSQAGYQYTAKDLKKMIAWAEEHTGKKLDHNRLREALKLSGRAHELMLKIREMAMMVPSPCTLDQNRLAYTNMIQLAGTPELVDYLQMVYDRAQDRLAGKLPYPVQEKLRIAWIYTVPTYTPNLIVDHMANEFGAISTTFMLNNMLVPPLKGDMNYEDMILWLAEKVCNMPMTRECRGPWEVYADSALDLVQNYQADGAVFSGHLACKSNWAAAKLVKDKIMEVAGVPTLNLETDFIDPRVTSGEVVRDQLVDFMGLVKQHKAKRERKAKKD